jgi:S-adenosylmethionine hydrolase
MSIITLSSDLGTKDYYLGVLKGTILAKCNNVTIVDVTHEIPPFDIIKAAIIIQNFYTFYPEGSIHVVAVSSGNKSESKLLGAYYKGHFFLVPDNGLLSLILNDKPEKVVELNGNFSETKKVKITLGIAAGLLASGKQLNEIGTEIDTIVEKTYFKAVNQDNYISGNVFYIDYFGNVITNITKELFDLHGKGRPFVINLRQDYIESIMNVNYYDMPEGEKLALFTQNGFLKIAINKGNASRLLGLQMGSVIRIDFL